MKGLIILLLCPFLVSGQMMMVGASSVIANVNTPKFGVLVNSSSLTNSQKADVSADGLGCKYVRGALTIRTWSGSSTRYEIYRTKLGLGKQIPVINGINGGATPYYVGAEELGWYADTLALILDKYPDIKIVVIENEAINVTYLGDASGFHTGNLAEYAGEVAAAYAVCKPRNVKMVESGVYGIGLYGLIYRDLVAQGRTADAAAYAAIAMTPSQLSNVQTESNPVTEVKIRMVDSIMNLSPYFDYMNIHLYEVFNPNIVDEAGQTVATDLYIKYAQDYIQKRTHKQLITNELGQRNNTQPDLVTSLLGQYYRYSFPIIQWFSGVGSAGSQPLNNETTGAINPNGTAFKNYIQSKQ